MAQSQTEMIANLIQSISLLRSYVAGLRKENEQLRRALGEIHKGVTADAPTAQRRGR